MGRITVNPPAAPNGSSVVGTANSAHTSTVFQATAGEDASDGGCG